MNKIKTFVFYHESDYKENDDKINEWAKLNDVEIISSSIFVVDRKSSGEFYNKTFINIVYK